MNFLGLLLNVMNKIFMENKGKILFIWGLVSSWYVLIYGAAITTAYYVLMGLKKSGVYDRVYGFLESKLDLIVKIARECSVEIGNLHKFFDCM